MSSEQNPLEKKEAAAHFRSIMDQAGLDTGKGSLAAHAQSEADKSMSEALRGQSQGHQESPLEKKEAASRIQSTLDQAGYDTGEGSLVDRAQSEADKSINEALTGQPQSQEETQGGHQNQTEEIPLEKKNAAARIQSTLDKEGFDTGTGSFAARAQSEADKSINEALRSGRKASSAQYE